MKKQTFIKFDNFYKAVLSLKNTEECSAFFNDICTVQELEAIAQRLEVAVGLSKGESYIDVNKNTGASTATISRVSRCLNYGDGGYALAIQRIKEQKD